MKQLLYVDCAIRGKESRTHRIAKAFIGTVDNEKYNITHLELQKQDIAPLNEETLNMRMEILDRGELEHPMLRFAHQFAAADIIVIAAPFWDLSFPALLKAYIEQVSVKDITFCYTDRLYGICRAEKLIYITARGGCYTGDPMEQGSRYMESITKFFGINEYRCIAAEGLDIYGCDMDTIMDAACRDAIEAAKKL